MTSKAMYIKERYDKGLWTETMVRNVFVKYLSKGLVEEREIDLILNNASSI